MRTSVLFGLVVASLVSVTACDGRGAGWGKRTAA